MMRKVTILAAATVAAMSIPSTAGARATARTELRPYSITRAAVVSADDTAWAGTQPETFLAGPGDRRVTISLEDQSGQPVAGRVEVGATTVEFCSQTDKPLRVHRGDQILVSAVFGPCGGGVSAVTEGTIAASFTR